jgi:hypothetical protein
VYGPATCVPARSLMIEIRAGGPSLGRPWWRSAIHAAALVALGVVSYVPAARSRC